MMRICGETRRRPGKSASHPGDLHRGYYFPSTLYGRTEAFAADITLTLKLFEDRWAEFTACRVSGKATSDKLGNNYSSQMQTSDKLGNNYSSQMQTSDKLGNNYSSHSKDMSESTRILNAAAAEIFDTMLGAEARESTSFGTEAHNRERLLQRPRRKKQKDDNASKESSPVTSQFPPDPSYSPPTQTSDTCQKGQAQGRVEFGSLRIMAEIFKELQFSYILSLTELEDENDTFQILFSVITDFMREDTEKFIHSTFGEHRVHSPATQANDGADQSSSSDCAAPNSDFDIMLLQRRVAMLYLIYLLYNSQYGTCSLICHSDSDEEFGQTAKLRSAQSNDSRKIPICISHETLSILLDIEKECKATSLFPEARLVLKNLLDSSAFSFCYRDGPQYLYQDRYGDPLPVILDKTDFAHIEKGVLVCRGDNAANSEIVDDILKLAKDCDGLRYQTSNANDNWQILGGTSGSTPDGRAALTEKRRRIANAKFRSQPQFADGVDNISRIVKRCAEDIPGPSPHLAADEPITEDIAPFAFPGFVRPLLPNQNSNPLLHQQSAPQCNHAVSTTRTQRLLSIDEAAFLATHQSGPQCSAATGSAGNIQTLYPPQQRLTLPHIDSTIVILPPQLFPPVLPESSNLYFNPYPHSLPTPSDNSFSQP